MEAGYKVLLEQHKENHQAVIDRLAQRLRRPTQEVRRIIEARGIETNLPKLPRLDATQEQPLTLSDAMVAHAIKTEIETPLGQEDQATCCSQYVPFFLVVLLIGGGVVFMQSTVWSGTGKSWNTNPSYSGSGAQTTQSLCGCSLKRAIYPDPRASAHAGHFLGIIDKGAKVPFRLGITTPTVKRWDLFVNNFTKYLSLSKQIVISKEMGEVSNISAQIKKVMDADKTNNPNCAVFSVPALGQMDKSFGEALELFMEKGQLVPGEDLVRCKGALIIRYKDDKELSTLPPKVKSALTLDKVK